MTTRQWSREAFDLHYRASTSLSQQTGLPLSEVEACYLCRHRQGCPAYWCEEVRMQSQPGAICDHYEKRKEQKP